MATEAAAFTREPGAATSAMVSFSTLDLLLLTYNCGKTAIDVPIFAAHLESALTGQSTAAKGQLPDLVVFSLQEVSPLGHAFVGSYFLSPFLARFEKALNQAAVAVEGGRSDYDDNNNVDNDDDAAGPEDALLRQRVPALGGASASLATGTPLSSTSSSASPYTFVRHANVGMTVVLLFARHGTTAASIRHVEVAECGFGVADMGNKGAVALRVHMDTPETSSSPLLLTFVATHLAPMEWNVRRRNANWRTIMTSLTFGNPREVVEGGTGAEGAETLVSGSNQNPNRRPQGRLHDSAACEPQGDDERESERQHQALQERWQGPDGHDARRRLQQLSVFHPDSLLFVAGDLNYRIDSRTPPPGSVFPTAETWPAFFARDQLTEEREAGRVFQGLREAAITFAPTYKHDVLPGVTVENADKADNADELRAWAERGPRGERDDRLAPVPWKYARHRWPSWCDRVLYLDVPKRVQKQWTEEADQNKNKAPPAVEVVEYASLPLMRTSDHQPVYFRARVPLVGRGDDSGDDNDESAQGPLVLDPHDATFDPRDRLLVPIDLDAWQRRQDVRQREVLAGWGMLLFNTQGGALAMATVVAVAFGAYWVWVGMWPLV